MIRRLRRAHRVLFILLAMGIPVLLTKAFASRPQWPISTPPLPGAATINPSGLADTWATQLGPLRYRLQPPGSIAPPVSITLGPATSLRAPDLLVYWTKRETPVATIVDGDLLLGRLDGEAPVVLSLPPSASGRSGRLVLYSLAHRSVVGTLELPSGQGSSP